MLYLHPDQIGGGRAVRRFSGHIAGDLLSAAELRGMKNLRALIKANMVAVWPKPPEGEPPERLVVRAGPASPGLFHVFEGRRLNDAPLSREQADALAQAAGGA